MQNGSYQMVVYCSVCPAELSRTNHVNVAPGHKAAEAVVENVNEATCTKKGSYDDVVYCSVCGEKLSSVTKEIPVVAHTPAEAVKENVVAPTFDAKGSYESVVYCSVCGKELSRTSVEVEALVAVAKIGEQRFETLADAIKAAKAGQTIVLVGDVTENCLDSEWADITELMLKYNYGDEVILASGNHDIRLRLYNQSYDRFTNFTNTLNKDESMTENAYAEGKFAYAEVINGYKFIVMGSDKTEFEEAYISPEQLEWLDNEIATEKGKPVFVVLHQPLKLTHNLPTTWGNGTNKEAGSVGPQNDEIKAVLAKHAADKTVVLLTGHLHAGFSQYSYLKHEGGFHSINAPAFSIENKDGEEGGNGAGLTYIIEAYDDEILFRARNCRTGEWLTKWDSKITLK
jgi:predicted phosphodiesterase